MIQIDDAIVWKVHYAKAPISFPSISPITSHRTTDQCAMQARALARYDVLSRVMADNR
jgi:hypothetical protein